MWVYKTYDQIVSEMQSDMLASGSQATDFTDGSQIQTMIQVTSRALYTEWFMLELLVELFFVSSCEGPLLDLRTQERGVYRNLGEAATGPITFSRTTASPIGTEILAGTQFATLDGSIVLTTNADDSLPSGWETGQTNVTCTTVGVAGNLAAGTVLQVVGPSPAGLQTITVGPQALSGGVDAETDDELRTRYLFVIQNPVDGGTPADYVVWAEEVAGITNVVPVPLARGNGTVDVVVAANGIPSADTVQQVQDVLNSNRPIGADAQAKAPTAHSIDTTITVTLADGYTLAGVQPSVLQAYNNYLASIAIGGVYRVMAAADAIFKVSGIIDCTVSGTNTQLAQEEMAVPGNVSVEQGS